MEIRVEVQLEVDDGYSRDSVEMEVKEAFDRLIDGTEPLTTVYSIDEGRSDVAWMSARILPESRILYTVNYISTIDREVEVIPFDEVFDTYEAAKKACEEDLKDIHKDYNEVITWLTDSELMFMSDDDETEQWIITRVELRTNV